MPEVRDRGAGAGGLVKDAARVIEIRNWEQREEQEAHVEEFDATIEASRDGRK